MTLLDAFRPALVNAGITVIVFAAIFLIIWLVRRRDHRRTVASLPVVVVNDCRDEDSRMRLELRALALFRHAQCIRFYGAKSKEMPLFPVDALDALLGTPAVFLLNAAPRNGEAKCHKNGAEFGHVQVGDTHFFMTVDSRVLEELARALNQEVTINIYPLDWVLPKLGLDQATQARVAYTQFRSFEYLARLAAAVLAGRDLPFTPLKIKPQKLGSTYADVLYVDCFGNAKTNHTGEGFTPGSQIEVVCLPSHGPNESRILTIYSGLCEIPDHEIGIVIGSSGINDRRYVEIQQQGVPAAETLRIAPGSILQLTPLS